MSFDIFLLEFQFKLTVRATAKTFEYLNAVTRWQNAAHFFLHSDSYSVSSTIHWKQLPAHWSFDFLLAILLRGALLISLLLLFCFSGFKI